jgi:type II secretory pathway component PulL
MSNRKGRCFRSRRRLKRRRARQAAVQRRVDLMALAVEVGAVSSLVQAMKFSNERLVAMTRGRRSLFRDFYPPIDKTVAMMKARQAGMGVI